MLSNEKFFENIETVENPDGTMSLVFDMPDETMHLLLKEWGLEEWDEVVCSQKITQLLFEYLKMKKGENNGELS